MLHKVFCFENHEDYGEGWLEQGKNHFTPLQGLAVAHDCLEHFPDDGPNIEHEFMALGASIYVRANIYYHNPWHENMLGEMPDLYSLWDYEGVPFSEPSRSMFWPMRRSMYEHVDKNIQLLVDKIPAYLMENVHGGGDTDPEKIAEDKANTEKFALWGGAWLRQGFRRALKRYHRTSDLNTSYIFEEIKDAADSLVKRAVVGESKLFVEINLKRGQVRFQFQEYPEAKREEID